MCAAQPGPAAGPLANRAWVVFAVTLFILIVVVAILIACWWSGAAALVEPGSHGHAAMAAGAEPDDPNQRAVRSPSGHLCEAGHYLTEDCYMGQARGCCPCPPGSFLSHPNREESCLLCTRCREDQEMVRDCTPTRDRQCQCKPGEYYCDSERCLEGCHPCTRCRLGRGQPCRLGPRPPGACLPRAVQRPPRCSRLEPGSTRPVEAPADEGEPLARLCPPGRPGPGLRPPTEPPPAHPSKAPEESGTEAKTQGPGRGPEEWRAGLWEKQRPEEGGR